MRSFKLFQTLLVVLGIALLSGCSMFGSYATSVSNKNPDTENTTPANQKCNNWCHNGWCSTHCEPAVSGE